MSKAKQKRDPGCLSFLCPDQRKDLYESAATKKVAIGMSGCLVRAAWGDPGDVNRTIRASGTSEQWVYHSRQYVYLEDDVVTAIQD